MADTDIAGEGQEAPVVIVKGYRATLGKTTSDLLPTREAARGWIATRRQATGDHDSNSAIDVEV